MMHSGDNPGSISERDLRVTASQLRADENDARSERFGEVTADELDRRYADPISRAEMIPLLIFITSFCEGRSVWAYELKQRHGRPTPTWTPITEWDAHFEASTLSLTYRTDNPFAADEPTFHASHEAPPTTATKSDGAATALRGDAVE